MRPRRCSSTKPVRIGPGQGPDQRRLAVIDVPGGGDHVHRLPTGRRWSAAPHRPLPLHRRTATAATAASSGSATVRRSTRVSSWWTRAMIGRGCRPRAGRPTGRRAAADPRTGSRRRAGRRRRPPTSRPRPRPGRARWRSWPPAPAARRPGSWPAARTAAGGLGGRGRRARRPAAPRGPACPGAAPGTAGAGCRPPPDPLARR